MERKEKGGDGDTGLWRQKGEREKDPEMENKRASLRGKPEEMSSAFQEEEMVFLEESLPSESSPHSRWISD